MYLNNYLSKTPPTDCIRELGSDCSERAQERRNYVFLLQKMGFQNSRRRLPIATRRAVERERKYIDRKGMIEAIEHSPYTQ